MYNLRNIFHVYFTRIVLRLVKCRNKGFYCKNHFVVPVNNVVLDCLLSTESNLNVMQHNLTDLPRI
jgi:hypothetical protein